MTADPMHGFDASRAGTCEYTDVHYPDPLDVTVPREMQVVDAGVFRDFGGLKRFVGPASTIKCYENNPLVREALGEQGNGRVLVVDGGGSMRCALLGDNLAGMAVKNGWAGIVINGCLRDSEDIGHDANRSESNRAAPGEEQQTGPGLTRRPGDVRGSDGATWGLDLRGHGRHLSGRTRQVRALNASVESERAYAFKRERIVP
jgi:RraA family protein